VLTYAFYGDCRNASFRGANLSGASLAHARPGGADLTGARLTITSIKGADLHRAKGMTQAQGDQACDDAETRLPAKPRVKTCS